MAPVHHLPAPPARPPRRHNPESTAGRPAYPLRQSRRIPGPRHRPLPRRHPPRRHRPWLPATTRPLQRRPALRRHHPGRQDHHSHRRRASRTCTAQLRHPDRRPAHPRQHRPARHRTSPVRASRSQLHRQIRHQEPHRPRPARPAADNHLRHERPALLSPLQADDHHRLAARLQARHRRPPIPAMGPHARLRRPLPHQEPPLLRHLQPAPPGPHHPPPNPAASRRRTRSMGPPLDETVVLVIASWTYAGTGYTASPGAELATASAAWAREHRSQPNAA